MTPAKSAIAEGVAMIVTLSILLVLSMALMKTFESRSVEVAHLSNDIHRFQAESLSRSLFRATLSAIRQKGLLAVRHAIGSLPAGIPVFLESGYFSDLAVLPIDHRFNLNKSFLPISDPDRGTIFYNVVQGIRSRSENEEIYFELMEHDVYPLLSALNDWYDSDDIPDDAYQDGIEMYPFEEPPFEIKNGYLDFLSEVKLIPRFRELGLSHRELHRHFRANKGGDLEFIDINLASEDEISAFLNNYENLETYRTVYENRIEIAEIAKQDMPLSAKAKYPIGSEPYGRSSEWRRELESLGVFSLLTAKEKELFRLKTDHIEISFVVSVGNVSLRLNSTVKLHYGGSKKDKIERFTILSLSYR